MSTFTFIFLLKNPLHYFSPPNLTMPSLHSISWPEVDWLLLFAPQNKNAFWLTNNLTGHILAYSGKGSQCKENGNSFTKTFITSILNFRNFITIAVFSERSIGITFRY